MAITVRAVTGDGYFELIVEGHEGGILGGQLCAAVTAITQTALLGLDEYAFHHPDLLTVNHQQRTEQDDQAAAP